MTHYRSLKFLTALTCALILAGCASTGPSGSGSQQATKQAMAACLATSGQSKFLLFHVPAADNAISNQMIVSALKFGGGSNSVDALIKLFQKTERTTVLVVGDHAAVTLATAEAALRELPVDARRAAHQLCIAADRNAAVALDAAAKAAGVELRLVP